MTNSYWYDDFKLIEGIGSTNGLILIFIGEYFGEFHTLECFKQDGVSAYPAGEECELYTLTGIDEKTVNIIAFHPNPTRGLVNFEFTDLNVQRLTIFTITGEVILEKSEIKQDELIDLTGRESGVYIVKIQTDRNVITSKLIKE